MPCVSPTPTAFFAHSDATLATNVPLIVVGYKFFNQKMLLCTTYCVRVPHVNSTFIANFMSCGTTHATNVPPNFRQHFKSCRNNLSTHNKLRLCASRQSNTYDVFHTLGRNTRNKCAVNKKGENLSWIHKIWWIVTRLVNQESDCSSTEIYKK